MSQLREKVENFLYKEVRLMDENRYGEWLELWAKECLYWVPSNKEDVDPKCEVSIIYSDRATLELYVGRLLEGKAFAQVPASRLRRIISNVEIEEGGPELQGEVSAYANFIAVEVRKHEQRVHAGRTHYKLVPNGDSFLIKYKKVNLVAIDNAQDNLTFAV